MSKPLKPASSKNTDQDTLHVSPIKIKLFYVITILIPILFIALLELGLRFFNYGLAYNQWVETNNGQWLEKGGKMLMLNPEIAHKYFHIYKNIPFPNLEPFDKLKKPNAFRIFILGESSGAGYPYEPNGSFTRYLRDRLSLVYPSSKIEVINCSITGINSYTLRDLTPGILEQKPDLILFYAGHNEYYGALGASSIESGGNFRFIVNLVIYLEKFRTFQLIRNAINALARIFSGKVNIPSGTLMERMARDKYIPYDSDTYKRGLLQFEGNMNDILKMVHRANIPVIIGTLTCNLKDQPPFVSIPSSGDLSAEKTFNDAHRALAQKNYTEADSLFRYAKDLDALRFRAPTEMNHIIHTLAGRYNTQVLDIDSAFNAASPDHVVGNNLMIDHLHPTLHGYQLIGKLFFDKMKEMNSLPKSRPINLPDRTQDSLTITNFSFSLLDSYIADDKMVVLKSNWPFAKNTSTISSSMALHPRYAIDSLAAQYMEQKISWKNAHLSAAGWYLDKNDISQFLKEMDVIVNEYPYVIEYYQYIVSVLLPLKESEQVYRYLSKSYSLEPDAFNTKWLGLIFMDKGEMDSARYYLSQSLTFNNEDPEVWYNIAVTYVKKDKNEALTLIRKVLTLDPNYTNAFILYKQLANSQK